RSPPATTAPVFPALTSPSTRFSASNCQHLKTEASGFLRRASDGFSLMSTLWEAWTTSSRPAGAEPAASNGSSRAWSPTSTTVRSGTAVKASTAPATFGPGPWSPPIASSASRMGSLPLLLRFHIYHLAALVRPAVRAQPVRQDRLVALRAELDLDRGDVV